MAKIKNFDNTKCCQGHVMSQQNFPQLLVGGQNATSSLEKSLAVFNKTKHSPIL